jgi:hypothetical protein
MHIYPEFLAFKIVLSRLPYFYIIQHIATGAYYAGYKSCKPNSLAFMTPDGYQTSSKTVKNIIAKEGLDSFRIIRIHHFETKEEAFKYETRFLKKVGVPYNSRFLNQHVTNNFTTSGKKHSEATKIKMSAALLGRKFSDEHKVKMRGPRGPLIRPRRSRGPQSDETKAKIKSAKLGRKHSNESKVKMRGPRAPRVLKNLL